MIKLNAHAKSLRKKAAEDIVALFSGVRTGHLGYMLYGPLHYPDTDFIEVDYWASNQASTDFYIPDEEATLIESIAGNLSVKAESLVDLGPGEEKALQQKASPLVSALNVEKYVAVDATLDYVDAAMNYISATNGIITEGYVVNFFDKKLPFTRSNTLLFMAGSTITNIPVDITTTNATLELSRYLRYFRGAVDDSSHFLIGYDANQNISSLDRSYNNPVFAHVIENLMWRIRVEHGFDFNPALFKYEGEWIADEHRFAHYLVAKENVHVSGHGQRFRFLKGHRFHVQNSYKFPPEMMSKAAENAGWKTKKIWTETGRVHYMLFEAA
jgi:uncharacterized SAM-dependent methyltransferase